jgi:hypothetical protein
MISTVRSRVRSLQWMLQQLATRALQWLRLARFVVSVCCTWAYYSRSVSIVGSVHLTTQGVVTFRHVPVKPESQKAGQGFESFILLGSAVDLRRADRYKMLDTHSLE